MSFKYSKIVVLLLAITMIPVLIHSYIGAKEIDSYRTDRISTNLGGIQFVSSGRNETWGDVFASADWIERRSTSANHHNLLLFVARSYNYKRLYHHPELAVLYGKALKNGGVKTLKTKDSRDLNVHFLIKQDGNGLAGYCLSYDDKFIENPILFQLSTSIKLLVTERKPMTLFFVYDDSLTSVEEFEKSTAGIVLKSAIEEFYAQNSSL